MRGVIRRIAERVSRERVLRRRLPAAFGSAPIYVSPDSALSYWRRDLGRVGQELFDFAEEFVQPEDTVWDVGANVGLFTFAAAQRASARGTVVAFEPDGFSASLLRRTARSEHFEARVDVLPLAVSDACALLEFHIAERGRSSSHLAHAGGNSQSGGSRDRISVPAVTLDWTLGQRAAPDVIKIDVEGAEVQALRGAERLLEEHRPVLLCEVGAASTDVVTEILRGSDYTLYDWTDRARREVARATFSTLALPN